jgi:hypothetical protein
MAPPVSLGGKSFIALLMLSVVGLLIRLLRGGPSTDKSLMIGAILSVLAVSTLEAVFPNSYRLALHDRGILAAIIGGIMAAVALRPDRPRSAVGRTSAVLRLSILAFITGPLLGLLFAALTFLLFDVSPLDQGYTLGMWTSIGALAGLIGAGLIAVVSLSKPTRSSE